MSVIIPLTASADPNAPRTIPEVTQKLDQLSHRNEYLTEKFNMAQDDVNAKEKAAKAADVAAKNAGAQFVLAQRELSVTISEDYKGSQFSHAGALLTSKNGQNYIDMINALDLVSVRRTDVFTQANEAKTTAAAADEKAAALLKQATDKRDALAKQRKDLAAQQQKYTDLLNTLNAQQRAAFFNRNAAPPAQVTQVLSTPVHAGSSAAQTAINFAEAQVGKPYVYAASGPDSYDCSGLTMAAYAAAGISLPHNAAEQYNYGTHVSESDLQPGDLVFFYNPIGHVALYLGGGMIVHAPEPGDVVKIVALSVFGSDYVGATRLT